MARIARLRFPSRTFCHQRATRLRFAQPTTNVIVAADRRAAAAEQVRQVAAIGLVAMGVSVRVSRGAICSRLARMPHRQVKRKRPRWLRHAPARQVTQVNGVKMRARTVPHVKLRRVKGSPEKANHARIGRLVTIANSVRARGARTVMAGATGRAMMVDPGVTIVLARVAVPSPAMHATDSRATIRQRPIAWTI